MAKKAANNSQALAKYDAELAELAKSATEMQSAVGSSGNWLSIRAGVLSYQGTPVEGNKMNCVILDGLLENQLYGEEFDADNPTSPICYAFGRIAKDMVPHEQAPEPQHSDCHTCPNMQFGSADKGKGKACKACQRLAIITEGDLDNVEGAEIAKLKLPFYSTLEYAAYVRQLKELKNRPPCCFVTELSVHPDVKAQFKVKFKMIEEIEDAKNIGVLLDMRKKAIAELEAPYPEFEQAPAKPARARAKPRVAPRATAKPAARRKPAAAPPAPAPEPVAAGENGGTRVGLRRTVKPAKF